MTPVSIAVSLFLSSCPFASDYTVYNSTVIVVDLLDPIPGPSDGNLEFENLRHRRERRRRGRRVRRRDVDHELFVNHLLHRGRY